MASGPDQRHFRADRYARPKTASNPASKSAQRMKQRNRVRAEAAVDAGLLPNRQPSWKRLAMNEILKARAAQARENDPLEQAKLTLRRARIVVYSQGIDEGGDWGLYTVGNRKNLTADDVIRMAGKVRRAA